MVCLCCSQGSAGSYTRCMCARVLEYNSNSYMYIAHAYPRQVSKCKHVVCNSRRPHLRVASSVILVPAHNFNVITEVSLLQSIEGFNPSAKQLISINGRCGLLNTLPSWKWTPFLRLPGHWYLPSIAIYTHPRSAISYGDWHAWNSTTQVHCHTIVHTSIDTERFSPIPGDYFKFAITDNNDY